MSRGFPKIIFIFCNFFSLRILPKGIDDCAVLSYNIKKIKNSADYTLKMTIKEIAEQLNISISTVSKALNGATDVSESKRKLILDYAEKVGYAVRRKPQENRRICLLFESFDSENRNEMINSVMLSFNKYASSHGYEVVHDSVDSKPEDFDLAEYFLQNNFSAAFIVGINSHSRIFRQLVNSPIPIVLLDNHVPNAKNIATVSSDNISAIEAAVYYLNDMGHEKIGFVAGERESLVSAERLAGYILGMARRGLDVNGNSLFYGNFTRESGRAATEHYKDKDFTAVICCSDYMAIGLIDGLTKAGRRVPDDISVTGFDDLEFLKFTNYNLTTIKQDFDRMGKAAFRLLVDMLDGHGARRTVLECQLIERGTVKKTRK